MLRMKHVFSFALLLSVTIQSCYWIIGSGIAENAILLSALVVAASGLVMVIGHKSGIGAIVRTDLVIAVASSVIYASLVTLFYSGGSLRALLQPVLMIVLIASLAVVSSVKNGVLLFRFRSLSIFVLGIAVVHLLQMLSSPDAISNSVNYTSQRYGYIDGINRINITAANLSYILMAAYLLSRAAANTFVRSTYLLACVFILIPIVATGSRSALIMAAVGIGLFELSQRSVQPRHLALTILAGAMAFALLSPNLIESLWSLGQARFSSNSAYLDPSTALRIDAIAASIQSENLLFGSGKTAFEYLGRSADNTFAEVTLSYGLLGFLLFSFSVYAALNQIYSRIALQRVPIFVLMPLLVQSLSEGFYIDQSTLFCALFFVLAGAAALTTPRTSASQSRSNFKHSAHSAKGPSPRQL